MHKKHKIGLAILVIITIVAFILFNLSYRESMLQNAVQFMNANQPNDTNPPNKP